jgi:type II secretory pathway component PulK
VTRMSVGRREAGYALLGVLWITLGITSLAFLINADARVAIATSRNRIALTKAEWSAAACGAHVRAALAGAHMDQTALRQPDNKRGFSSDVGRLVHAFPPPPELGCVVTTRPVGALLDVNTADSATLARLLRNAGMAAGRADTVATTLTLHKPYADRRAFRQLPGLATEAILDSLLDVESGPISLYYAPAPVLTLLPGFTDGTVREMLDARSRGEPVATFHDLSKLLSSDAPEASARLPAISVFQPIAWVLTVRAHAGTPTVTSVLELRLLQDGSVLRCRSWTE